MSSYPEADTGQGREQLGRVLRQARLNACRPQRTVAADAGIAPTQLSRYESGRVTPSWQVFRRVLASLGLQPRLFLEPLNADIDAAGRALRARPRSEWLSDVHDSVLVWRYLTAGCDTTATGALAARLLGAPVPLRVLTGSIVLGEHGWEAVAAGARQWSALVEEPRTGRHEVVVDGEHLQELAALDDQTVRFSHRLRPSITLRRVPEPPAGRVQVCLGDRWWWAEPVANSHDTPARWE